VQLGSINVFCHEETGGKYVPRAVLFDLEPGVIGAVRVSPFGELYRPKKLVNQNVGKLYRPKKIVNESKRKRGQQLGQWPLHRGSEDGRPGSRLSPN
jgi:hypothetical protein